MLKGIEAVLDKDLSSALVAVQVEADEFYILTDVPKVYINFKKEGEKALDILSVHEAETYLKEGQFTEGSILVGLGLLKRNKFFFMGMLFFIVYLFKKIY